MISTGGEVIVNYLIEEGVPYIIGIPGHGVLGLFDAVRKANGRIKYIQVKHEQASSAIADGYFRVTGRPLACFSSIGPGTLNSCIGLATAYVDSTAFLQLCGDAHVHMRGTGILQEVERYQDSNIMRALEPLAKRCWRAESIEQIPKIMRRAFGLMTNGRSGPCVVMLPMDVQCAEYEGKPYKAEYKIDAKPCADLESIAAAVRLMKTAKRPVILAGGGALKAKAGELPPGDFEEQWSSALTAALGAAGRVSRLLGDVHPDRLPSSALAFKGLHYELLLAPVGDFALVLFLKPERGVLRLPLAVEVIFNAQRELAHILIEMGINLSGPGSLPATGPLPELPPEVQAPPPAVTKPAPEPEMSAQEVAEFERLLKGGQPAPSKDLDAFWEQAAEANAPDYSNPGVLSYEQARRLGLAPDEENTSR
jgi:hypothetical protein